MAACATAEMRPDGATTQRVRRGDEAVQLVRQGDGAGWILQSFKGSAAGEGNGAEQNGAAKAGRAVALQLKMERCCAK